MKETSKNLIVAGMFVAALYVALIVFLFPAQYVVMILFAWVVGMVAGYCAHLLAERLVPTRMVGGVVLLRDWVWVSLGGLAGAVFAIGCISLINGSANLDLVVMGNVAFWLFLVLPITYVSDVGLKLAIDKKVPAWMGEKMSDADIEYAREMEENDDDWLGIMTGLPVGGWWFLHDND
ncbi:MAG: hypothetical protein M0Z50_17165 [Planctomycetia bacterium]|nr:hypothetical protein [Planctomycetia bacterium]